MSTTFPEVVEMVDHSIDIFAVLWMFFTF